MRLFSIIPALCLVGHTFAAPIPVPVESAEIQRSQSAGPADGPTITRAWGDLESLYKKLNADFKQPRMSPDGRGFDRGGVPRTHSDLMTFFDTGIRTFAPMKPLGILEATQLWFPTLNLRTTIKNTMTTIANQVNIVRKAGEHINVRNMLIDQQRSFSQWSAVLVKVLPQISGQQGTGQYFIDEVLKEYSDALKSYT